MTRSQLKKTIIIIISIIAILVIAVVLLISPIIKHLVEKYDKQYIGREVTMDWAYVNPFTGYLHFSGLTIYEPESDSVFLYSGGMTAYFKNLKIFSKTFEVRELLFKNPKGVIIQNGNKWEVNFSDILDRLIYNKTLSKKTKVKFRIHSLNIKNGSFYYRENKMLVNYFIKKVNIEFSGMSSNTHKIAVKFSFSSGMGTGNMKGKITINTKNKDYHLAIVAQQFDLSVLQQYFKALSNYGSFSAILDADINSKGNFINRENVTTRGKLSITDFHLGKNEKDDYVSFKKFKIAIKEISPAKHKYFYDSVLLCEPYIKYERYDSLDNFQRMFGKNGSKLAEAQNDSSTFNLLIEINNYLKVISKNLLTSHYIFKRLYIEKGNLEFNDYSLEEKFPVNLAPFSLVADSIDKNNKKNVITFNSTIKPYGVMSVNLKLYPQSDGDFDLGFIFKKIPISMFNPYIINYKSFPLNKGTVELNGYATARNGKLNSATHLQLIDLQITRKMLATNYRWVPIRLLMVFVRDKGNAFDIEIPVSGNLNNPNFDLWDAIYNELQKIVTKPIKSLSNIDIKKVNARTENYLTFSWEKRSSLVLVHQRYFLTKMAKFLKKNPSTILTITPQHYLIKEKEAILLFEAKKGFYMRLKNKTQKSLTDEDYSNIDSISIKDVRFVNYINRQTHDSMLFTIQDKCLKIIDQGLINKKFNQLNKERIAAFMLFFKEENVEKQIRVLGSVNTIPYNGFSFYKMKYQGELSEPVMDAYKRMDELDDKVPRKKASIRPEKK